MSTAPCRLADDTRLRSTRCWSTRRSGRCAGSYRTCRPQSGRSPRPPAGRHRPAARGARGRDGPDRDRHVDRGAVAARPPLRRRRPGRRTRCCSALVQAYLAAERRPPSSSSTTPTSTGGTTQRVRFLVGEPRRGVSPEQRAAGEPGVGQGGHRHRRAEPGARGRQLVRDLATPPRVPEMVDASGVRGRARTSRPRPARSCLRTEVFELIQYAPQTDEVCEVPLLIVPPTINKYYALDLAPGAEPGRVPASGQGQQVFVMSWRNPDARHAAWDFDTYVQARPRRARRGRADHRQRRGPCSAASAPAASWRASRRRYLAGIGRQDRLAGARPRGDRARQPRGGHGVRAWSTIGWRPRPRRCPARTGLPRRPGARRGVRLAAARRPDLELLGQQLPARQAAAGVRHPVLERRHHADDRRAARRLRRPGDGQRARPARARSPCSACRSTCRAGRPSTPTWSPASPTTSPRGRTATAAPSCFGGTTRFVLSTSGHIAALVNPPGNPKATYQTNDDMPADAKAWLNGRGRPPGHAGGPTSGVARASAAANRGRAPKRLGSDRLSVLAEAPGTYVFDK